MIAGRKSGCTVYLYPGGGGLSSRIKVEPFNLVVTGSVNGEWVR